MVNEKALQKLYFLNASSPYSEQVGINLQHGGKSGERIRRYTMIKPITILLGIDLINTETLFVFW